MLHEILSILQLVSENALKMKTFAHGKGLRRTIRLLTYPPLGVTLQKKVLRSGQKDLRVVAQLEKLDYHVEEVTLLFLCL